MVSEFKKGTIFPLPLRTDCTDRFAPFRGAGLYAQRADAFPVCAGLSSLLWRQRTGQGAPPALCLLGISLYGAAFGTPLGRGYGDGSPYYEFTHRLQILDRHSPASGRSDFVLWALRLFPQRYAGLSIAAILLCVFSTGPDSVTILDGLCGDHGSVLDYCPLWRNLPAALISQKNESINCIYIFQTKGLCE